MCDLAEIDTFWEDLQLQKKGRNIGDILTDLELLQTDLEAAEHALQTLQNLRAQLVVLFIDERSRPPSEFVASMITILSQYIEDITLRQKKGHDKLLRLREEEVRLTDQASVKFERKSFVVPN